MPYTTAAGRRLGEGGTTQPRGPRRTARLASAATGVGALALVAAVLLLPRADVLGELGSLEGRTLGERGTASAIRGDCAAATMEHDACRLVAAIDDMQEHWARVLPGYRPAHAGFFTGTTGTPCGPATSAVASLYCPRDRTLYVDLGFLAALESRLERREAELATAYVLAHELGHHVQQQVGALPETGTTPSRFELIAIELQADCYAGASMRQAPATHPTSRADATGALTAAATVAAYRAGDTPRAVSDAATHGRLRQRFDALVRGMTPAGASACDARDGT